MSKSVLKTMSAKCANTLPKNNNGILWTLLILLISDHLKAVWKWAHQALPQNFNQVWPWLKFWLPCLSLLSVCWPFWLSNYVPYPMCVSLKIKPPSPKLRKIWLKACSLIRRSLKKKKSIRWQAKKLPVIKNPTKLMNSLKIQIKLLNLKTKWRKNNLRRRKLPSLRLT